MKRDLSTAAFAWRPMRTVSVKSWLILRAVFAACLIVVLAPATASQAALILSDSTFSDADWSRTVLAVNKAGNGDTAAQDTTDDATPGNPAPFRFMTHGLVGATPPGGPFPNDSHIYVFHQFLGGSYDPSVDGAIATIDYQEDQNQFDQLFFTPLLLPSGVFATPALMQDGVVYMGPSISYNHADQWVTRSLTDLTAADFIDFSSVTFVAGGDGVFDNPDFSSTGSPIGFGYIRGNSNTDPNEAFTIKHGIDNWSVALNPLVVVAVPEPSALALFGLGLGGLALLGWRRRTALSA